MENVLKLVEQEKNCVACGESKPVSEFHRHSGGGLQPRCKLCRKVEAARPLPDKRKNVIQTENGRTCLKCGIAKNWDEFAKDIHGYNQKTATCKKCRNEKYKDPRKGDIKNRPDRLKRQYGITYEQVVHMLDSQFGRCANRACGEKISLDVPLGKGRAVIDHNHTTGKVRALLCLGCNSLLGSIETKQNLILGLNEYLTKHN